jgi:hypothetical protein
VDRATVQRLRNNYRETSLRSLGDKVMDGNLVHGGWTELVGAAYERRTYAFRFETTPAQDDALLALLNGAPNCTRFDLLLSNCADFARAVLNNYFPGKFKRSIFPDAGMTTPKQIAFKLVRQGRRHPEAGVTVFEIPQIPGYRRHSHSNKNVAESFVTTAYAVPIALVNPYLAGGIFVDYLIRGHFHIIPRHPQILEPGQMREWSAPARSTLESSNSGAVPAAAPSVSGEDSAAPPPDVPGAASASFSP